MQARTLALTLDIEADHGWTRPYRFEALQGTGPLQALLDARRAPLTAFATGEALQHDSPLWRWLPDRGDPVGLHSHAHPRPGSPWDPADLALALHAWRARFPGAPTLWRPPYGLLDEAAVPDLRDAGFTLLSTYRPRGGLVAAPDGGLPLLDRPVSRVLGLPLTLSVLQTVGPALLQALPPRAVLCLHLHDVVPVAARSALPLYWRAAYVPGRRHGPGLDFLARVLDRLQDQGIRLVHL